MQEKRCHCGGKVELPVGLESAVVSIIKEHKGKPDALFLVLQDIQKQFGVFPEMVACLIADGLSLPQDDVISLINDHPQFKPAPPAKYKISVCLGTTCYLRGSSQLLERLCQELALEPGDTSPDGKFSLEVVRCLGSCALSPVIMINDELYPGLEPESVKGILASCI